MTDGRPAGASPARASAPPARTRSGALLLTPSSRAATRAAEGAARPMHEGEVRVLLEGIEGGSGAAAEAGGVVTVSRMDPLAAAAGPSAMASTVRLKTRRSAKSSFNEGVLVIGDSAHDSLKHVRNALAVAGPQPDILHVLVRLHDVDELTVDLVDGRSLAYAAGTSTAQGDAPASAAALLATPSTHRRRRRAAAAAAAAAAATAAATPSSPASPSPRPSALTAALTATPGRGITQRPPTPATPRTPSSLVVRGRVLPAGSPAPPPSTAAGDAVVHLIVRRSTGRLALAPAGRNASASAADGFELRVCGSLSGTARALADAAAAAAGDAATAATAGAAIAASAAPRPPGGRPPRPPRAAAGPRHRLLMDGVELPPDEPLAAAGVRPGAVLELVPAVGGCDGEEDGSGESDDGGDGGDESDESGTAADWVVGADHEVGGGRRGALGALPSSSSASSSADCGGGADAASSVAATPESRRAVRSVPTPTPTPWSAPAKGPAATVLASSANAAAASSPSLSSPAHGLHARWRAARAGLLRGRLPELAPAGSGGSYFLRDAAGARVAVFKPADEEPDAALNPKRAGADGGPAASCRAGILPGEGAVREVAAFLLDRGFAGVPPTALVDLEERAGGGGGGGENASPGTATPPVVRVRRGSLQAYVPHVADAEEVGVSAFPVADVHRIALLDCRLANSDRNGSNMLVVPADDGGRGGEGVRLVPIDHAFILPATLDDIALEWRHWPQAALPLTEEAAAAAQTLDAEADLASLAAAGISLRRPCATTLRVCTALVKAAAARRTPPAVLAGAMMRGGMSADGGGGCGSNDRRSALERLVSAARRKVKAGGGSTDPSEEDDNDAALLAALRPLLEEYLDSL